jgi:tetratricopeptide (TPR) repeat protein
VKQATGTGRQGRHRQAEGKATAGPHSRADAVELQEDRPSPPTAPRRARQPRPDPSERPGDRRPRGAICLVTKTGREALRDTDRTPRQGYLHNALISHMFYRQLGSSHHPYKGKAIDLKQIGRELNVRYVLEGSVQRGGNRMRVNVQLIDAETGIIFGPSGSTSPWPISSTCRTKSSPASQAHSTASSPPPRRDARNRLRPPTRWTSIFRGWLGTIRARPLTLWRKRATFSIARSPSIPTMSEALVGSAHADFVTGASLLVTDPKAAFAAAEAKLTKALSSVPGHARGHMWLGIVEMWTKRAAQGVAECEHALTLDRNLATARAFIGQGKIFIGRAEETETHIAEALRLSPRDTSAYAWIIHAGHAKNHLGCWEQAVAWSRRSIEANRNFPPAHFMLSAALAQLGRLDEARSAVKAGLALNPTFSISSRPLLLDGTERRPDVSRSARTYPRRHAQGRGPRAMTAARRACAILAADVSAIRA